LAAAQGLSVPVKRRGRKLEREPCGQSQPDGEGDHAARSRSMASSASAILPSVTG
jgi:hypothetical protein